MDRLIEKIENLLRETEYNKQNHLVDISNTKLIILDVKTLRALLFRIKYAPKKGRPK